MKVETSAQVKAFVKILAPEPKHALVSAMKQLANGKGNIKPLQGEFAGYWRLRVKGYRVVFRYDRDVIRCDYIEKRSIIYEMLALELKKLEDL